MMNKVGRSTGVCPPRNGEGKRCSARAIQVHRPWISTSRLKTWRGKHTMATDWPVYEIEEATWHDFDRFQREAGERCDQQDVVNNWRARHSSHATLLAFAVNSTVWRFRMRSTGSAVETLHELFGESRSRS